MTVCDAMEQHGMEAVQHLKAADWTAGSSQSRGDRTEQRCFSSAPTLAV